MKTNDNCGNCRFFNPTVDNRQRGLCQRHPPQVVFTPDCATHDCGIKGIFPEMVFEDWCGEYQAEAVEQPKPAGESVDCVQCGIIYPPHFKNHSCPCCGRGLIESGSKPSKSTPGDGMQVAFEAGFKCCERGFNVQQAMAEFRKAFR